MVETGDLWSADIFPVVSPHRYILEGELARGGLGRILRARDPILGRDVAIKELLQDSPEAMDRFVREALFTARLQHPGIIPVYEIGRWASGVPFYAMKLVQGRSFDVVIAGARTLDERLALLPHVIAVADAIAYAHGQRVIHRDLKPSNILAGDFGETVVIDWGLTKDLGGRLSALELLADGRAIAQGQTALGQIVGTPTYMPPEQAAGEIVDERADVYSIGAVLYHALTGKPPYQGATAPEVLRMVVAGPPQPIDAVERELPHDLAAIVQKAMSVAPEDRYPTARELADDLKRFETGQLVGARSYSSADIVLRWVRRHKRTVSIAVFALLALAAGGGLSLQRVLRERDRARAAERAAEQARAAEMERSDELVLVQARHASTRDPTEAVAWLARLSPHSSRWGAARIIAADARDRGVARVYHARGAGVRALAFSASGAELLTWSDDGRVRAIEREGAAERTVAELGIGAEGAFSADGRLVALSTADGLDLVETTSGSRVRVATRHGGPPVRPFFSPAGDRLAASSGRALRVWTIASGENVTLETPRELELAAFAGAVPRIAATAHGGGDVLVFDLAAGRTEVVRGNGASPRAIAIAPDGTSVAIAARDSAEVRVAPIAGGSSAVFAAAGSALVYSPDGARLAIVSGAHVILAELATGETRTLLGHDAPVVALAYSRDSRELATASEDRTIRVWDLDASVRLRIAGPGPAADPHFAIAPDGDSVAITAGGAGVLVADLRASTPPQLLAEGTAAVLAAAAFSADGRRLVVAGRPSLITGIGGGERAVLRAPAARAAVFREEQGELLLLAEDGRLAVLGQNDSAERPVCQGLHTGSRETILSPDGRFVAMPALGMEISQLCEVSSGRVVELDGGRGLVRSLIFSHDGRWIAGASDDRTARVYDTAGGAVLHVLRAHDEPIGALAMSRDGRYVATAAGRTVRIWELSTGGVIVLRGHTAPVTGLDFAPHGARLVSSARDGTLRVWDRATGEGRAIRVFGAGAPASPRFAADGTRLLCTAGDRTVRVFAHDLPAEAEALRAWIGAATNVTIGPSGTLINE